MLVLNVWYKDLDHSLVCKFETGSHPLHFTNGYGHILVGSFIYYQQKFISKERYNKIQKLKDFKIKLKGKIVASLKLILKFLVIIFAVPQTKIEIHIDEFGREVRRSNSWRTWH